MKLVTTTYVFDASAQTVSIDNFDPLVIEQVMLIVNQTDGIIIYNPFDPAKGGTVTGTDAVLTLEYDTTSMSDTDKLMIVMDDANHLNSVQDVTAQQRLGNVTETAPSTDTASSGLNGRLQRIAQHLTSYLGLTNETAPSTDTDPSGLNGRLQRIAQRLTSMLVDTASLVNIDSQTSSTAGFTSEVADTVKVLGTATYTEATTKGQLIGAVRRDTDTSLVNTTNEIAPLQVSSGGQLKVQVFNGPSNLSVTVSGNSAGDLMKTEDGPHNSGDNGVMALAVRAASPTDRSAGPTDGDYEPLGVNERGALWVTPVPSANGGWDTKSCTSGDGLTALTNSAQAIKASAGVLGGWYIYNPNATAVFIVFYEIASGSVTVGTSTPKMVICIPATQAANVEFTNGITFATAISAAAVTTGGGNGAPTTALEANFFYK